MRSTSLALIASLALVAPAAAQTHSHKHDHGHANKKGDQRREVGAHVHGSGALDIAIDGNRVTLELRSPGADIAGFEGKAETTEAKAKQDAAIKKLEKTASLFTLSAAAQCTAGAAKIVVDQHEAQAGKPADAHSDYEASYNFTCAAPDKLTAIDVPFFKTFPGIGKLTVQIVTAKGQGGATIAAGKPKIDIGAILK